MRATPILALILSSPLFAQTTSTSDCEGAVQLCGGIYTETSAPLGTGNVYEFTGTCNQNLESSSLWYTFTVQDTGNLSFVLDPAANMDDYDWGLFNITNGGCAGINAQDGSSPEVACNSYGSLGTNGPTGISTANGGTGTSNGPGDLNGPPFNADLPVAMGQTYALVVMNWSGSTSGYTIDFTQSTASIYDVNPPEIISITADCALQNLQVTFSEPIVSSTVDATDFIVTSPSGAGYTFVSATPNDPGSTVQSGYTLVLDGEPGEGGMYTLIVTSSSGNVEDLCGNAIVDTTFTAFLNAPLAYDLDITTACNGAGGALQAVNVSGGTPPVSFYMSGTLLPDGIATGLFAGDYSMTVVDSADCEIEEVVTIPNHSISAQIPQGQDSLSCSNKTVTIEGVEVIPAQTVQYQWIAQTASGTDSAFSASTSPEVTQPGIYAVVVTEPGSGCTAEASVEIFATSLSNLDLSSLQLPSVVTPNGDGMNDVWRPFLPADPGMDITNLLDSYTLTIINRWGQPVHENGNGGPLLWNARDADDGTYFYTVAYRSSCGAQVDKEAQGHITVLR